MSVIVADGQSIFDICLQEFGQMDDLFTLLTDNNLSLNSKLASGVELEINNTGAGNENVKSYFKLNEISINTNQTTL